MVVFVKYWDMPLDLLSGNLIVKIHVLSFSVHI